MKASKGFTKCNNKLLFDNDLSPISKLVFVGISYHDRGRGCWAKKTTLARLLNVSIYQLRKALKELEEQGFILIHKRHNGHTDIIRVVKNTSTHSVANTATPLITDEIEVNEIELDDKKPIDVVENKDNKQEELQDEPTRPQTGHTAPNEVKPLPIHKDSTEDLLRSINERIRPQSFSYWFDKKVAVSFVDDASITIRCIDAFSAKWLAGNYTPLIEGITGKQVAFHARENKNGKEDHRHRSLE